MRVQYQLNRLAAMIRYGNPDLDTVSPHGFEGLVMDAVSWNLPGTFKTCRHDKQRREGILLAGRIKLIVDDNYGASICIPATGFRFQISGCLKESCFCESNEPEAQVEMTVWRDSTGWILHGPWVDIAEKSLLFIEDECAGLSERLMGAGKNNKIAAAALRKFAINTKSQSPYPPEVKFSSKSSSSSPAEVEYDEPVDAGPSTTRPPGPMEDDTVSLGCELIATDPSYHNFKRLVLDEKVIQQIQTGAERVNLAKFLNDEWDLKSIEPMGNRTALNFYGPPGTGKTAAALALAAQLGKPLLRVDYADLVSKWVGQTGNNIKNAFAEARRKNAILFFDEADALLAKRLSDESPQAQSSNEWKSILLQELDAFDGMTIFTTNFFESYDPAVIRRIALHIEFQNPGVESLIQIYENHIPVRVPRFGVDLVVLASKSLGLAGGDVKNVCVNAIIQAAISKDRVLTQELLETQLAETMKSKGLLRTKTISIAG